LLLPDDLRVGLISQREERKAKKKKRKKYPVQNPKKKDEKQKRQNLDNRWLHHRHWNVIYFYTKECFGQITL